MRRLLSVITLLSALSLFSLQAQQGFSVGFGAGPNIYYGSIVQSKNISYSMTLDGRYNFNNRYSLALSYSYNHLQASRYNELSGQSIKTNYFESSVNTIGLNFGVDVLDLIQNTRRINDYKVLFNLGAGYTFFSPETYMYQSSTGDYVLDQYHNSGSPNTPGSAFQINIGGEFSYEFTDNLMVFYSTMGHFALSPDLDGYNQHYADDDNDPSTPTVLVDGENDFYYAGIVGVRYHFGGSHYRPYSRSPRRRVSASGRSFFRFDRFIGKKTAKSSIKTNRNNGVFRLPDLRFWQRKKTKNNIPKTSSTQRYQGRKTDGNIPK